MLVNISHRNKVQKFRTFNKVMNLKFKSIRKILGFSLLCLFLLACSEPEPAPQLKAEGSDWVKDEILQQLNELRKDVKSVKDDIAKLDEKLDTVSAGKPRGATAPKQVELNDGIILGDANAKIAIVEFTDYQCPFCARHSKTVFPQIKEQLIDTGKVKYVMYDYPLEFHPQAKSAAVAARCAGKQGKYWAMHDVIFNNQRGLNQALYEKTAKDLQLDLSAFANCLNDDAMNKRVEANLAYGSQIGVSGTPKFFAGKVKGDVIIDVIAINGAQPFSAFSNAVARLNKM